MPQDTSTISRVLGCESYVRKIISKQQRTGVNFDARKAHWYVYVLENRKVDLYQKIRPNLQLEVQRKYTVAVNKPFLKSGNYNQQVKGWYGDQIPDISGPFSRVEFSEPDLGSRTKLIEQLLRLGWKPKAFTDKGNPKLTVNGSPCDSLLKIGSEIGQQIADWYIYNHRQSQIQGWINRLRPDGRLTAAAVTVGTPTFRFRHSIVVNVPKAAKSVPFGKEMRSLFIADEGEDLVGHDASGLELRMLAHYMNDPEYTDAILNGDIHTMNMTAAGLTDRDQAKTFIYAFLYGAGDAKIGDIVNGTAAAGKKLKAQFLENTPALAALIKRVKKAAKRGYLVGLDGRKILLRRDENGRVQDHKALNTLLQTAGATVMKYSIIFLDNYIRENNLHSKKVIDMHDEGQYSVPKQDTELHCKYAVQSLIDAGEFLNLRIPLDGEAKVGKNWAQTH